jgi:hypothetical protein
MKRIEDYDNVSFVLWVFTARLGIERPSRRWPETRA